MALPEESKRKKKKTSHSLLDSKIFFNLLLTRLKHEGIRRLCAKSVVKWG